MEELKYIELSGKKYPYKFTNYTLQEAQEKYGNVHKFEMLIKGLAETKKKDEKGNFILKRVEPSLGAINFILPKMINQGLEIEARNKNVAVEYVHEDVLVEITDMSFHQLSLIIGAEMNRCLQIKNLNPKQEIKSLHQ